MTKTVFSGCPHDCPDACAFKIRLEEGRVGIEANERLPWTTFICPKGKRWGRRIFDAGRLTTPLLRREGNFIPLSVDDALDLWAERLSQTVREQGPLAVFFYQGAGSLFFSKNLLAHPLAELGGYRTTRGSLCGAAGNAGLEETFGVVPVQSVETFAESTQAVLFWGRNVAETHLHLLPLLQRIRGRGGRLGAVEIRPTATTALADRWWQVHPGSDAFLAAWLCLKLLERGLTRPGWEARVDNGEAFTAFLFDLDETALLARTGLDRHQGEALLDWLLEEGPVTLYGGWGLQRYLHGNECYRWIAALAVLLGAFEEPGGGVFFGKDEMARFPTALLPRPPQIERLPIAAWHRELESLEPRIGQLIVSNGNPLRQAPDTEGLRRAFDSIPFKICLDLTLTETARSCDLVLPVASFLEEGPDWRGSYWHRYLIRSEAALPPPPSVWPETLLFSKLSQRLGLRSDPEAMRETMDDLMLADREIEEVGDGIYAWREPEFWRNPRARAALPESLPEGRQPGGNRLRLVTVHVAAYINSQNWDLPEAEALFTLKLAPEELHRRGLADGKKALLTAENGRSLEVIVTSDKNLAPGLALSPQGGPDVNRLTPPLSSPGSGAPFHETFVTVSALKRSGRSGP